MEKFVIEGGVPLRGDVTPAGNKNAALPLLAACMLTDEPVVLRNIPHIQDVVVMRMRGAFMAGEDSTEGPRRKERGCGGAPTSTRSCRSSSWGGT